MEIKNEKNIVIKEVYKIKKYFAIALDPVHIGSGGYRIGRVDNTIIRDSATGIPKIPGTTINGVCRSYAYLEEKASGETKIRMGCAKGKTIRNEFTGKEEPPCGECNVCVTFGYARKDVAMQAMALFSDAQILFFPVATMIGPVWVTCPMVLDDFGIEVKTTTGGNPIESIPYGEFIIPPDSELNIPDKKLNFGWLLLYEKNNNAIANSQNKNSNHSWTWSYEEGKEYKKLNRIRKLDKILKRTVIVSSELFTQIVNLNLEVRTSVSIDPSTGTAEEKALFTYEAIPRGTVFCFDVTYQNPSFFPKYKRNKISIENIVNTVENGFIHFKHLGIGGMGSRGFGRIDVLSINK